MFLLNLKALFKINFIEKYFYLYNLLKIKIYNKIVTYI